MRGKTSSGKLADFYVLEDINFFPAYQSHYARKRNPNRKYLSLGLTASKMQSFKCNAQKREILFNLHFKQPRQNTCRLCDDLELKIKAQDNNAPLRQQAEQPRNSLKSNAANMENAYIITFDLQKALPCPKLTTYLAYYKINLYLYNLGIHGFNDQVGYM